MLNYSDLAYRTIYHKPHGSKITAKCSKKIEIEYGSKYFFHGFLSSGLVDNESILVVFDRIIEVGTILYAWDNGTHWLIKTEMDNGFGYLELESEFLEGFYGTN